MIIKVLINKVFLISLFIPIALMWGMEGKAQSLWWLSGVQMKVKGTSSLHDREMNVEKVSGEHQLEIDSLQVVIKDINVEVPVNSLKGDSRLMDSKAYKVLKRDKYPVITFQSAGPFSYE